MDALSRRAFAEGAQHTLPLIIGAIPFGIVFGTLGPASGLSVAATLGMSLLVFAGSAQFIALGLLASGTPIALVIAVTFVVNLRHFLYTVTLMPSVRHLPLSWRAPMSFWLPGIENWGLDVAMAVTFIGIVVPQISSSPKLICALSACICSLLWHRWPHHTGLMAAAITAVTLAMLAERINRSSVTFNDE